MTNLILKAEGDQSFGATVLKLKLRTPLLAFVPRANRAERHADGHRTTPPDAVAFTRQGADGQTTLTTPCPAPFMCSSSR